MCVFRGILLPAGGHSKCTSFSSSVQNKTKTSGGRDVGVLPSACTYAEESRGIPSRDESVLEIPLLIWRRYTGEDVELRAGQVGICSHVEADVQLLLLFTLALLRLLLRTWRVDAAGLLCRFSLYSVPHLLFTEFSGVILKAYEFVK